MTYREAFALAALAGLLAQESKRTRTDLVSDVQYWANKAPTLLGINPDWDVVILPYVPDRAS